MIRVKVDQLFFSDMGGFVVFLKGITDERSLPVFIGAAEAQAIVLPLRGVKMPRPLTHDLLKNAFDFLECRLKRVEVCDLKEGTFYGKLVLEKDAEDLEMDSRPSDAIALALRCGAPIFVAEKVMEEAGRVFTPEEIGQASGQKEKDGEAKKPPTRLDSLKLNLSRAIQEERYEEAAKIRDEIRRVEHTQTAN